MHYEHVNCIWEIEVEQSSVDRNLNKSAVVILVIYGMVLSCSKTSFRYFYMLVPKTPRTNELFGQSKSISKYLFCPGSLSY